MPDSLVGLTHEQEDMDQAQLDQVASLLKIELGTQARLEACREVNRQQDYRVLIARLRHPDLQVVVKLAGPAATMACQFEHSAAVYRLVRSSTSLPVPEVVAVDASGQAWPWRYLILTALPGIEWRVLRGRLDREETAEAQGEIGASVARLHQLGLPAFGQIGSLGQVLQPTTTGLAALKEHAARIIPAPRHCEAFLAVLEQRAASFENLQHAGLCHEDLHHGNLLFARQAGRWRLSGILDFDKAWAGLSEADLARLEIWRGMTSPHFWDAYLAAHRVEDGYPERRPVHQLLWCLEYGRNTPEHLADTRRVCQELGCPVIETFA